MRTLLFQIILVMTILTSQSVVAQTAQTTKPEQNDKSVYKDFKTEHLWNAKVKISQMINVGKSKYGTRRVIPITGGTFEGSKIKGVVLPGGEDWQLVRPDGDTELYARYLLKTEDGVVIQVTNRALMHSSSTGFYTKSVIDLEAPIDSPYEYLNHAIILGTLEMPMLKQGEDPYVIIGFYKVL
jgi:hypothetical protein